MPPLRSNLGSFAIIGLVVAGAAVAFAYAGGWLTPGRLTPAKVITALAPPGGPALGHRRNHAKGICFTGSFQSNGSGAALSRAQLFAAGTYPALGRFNLATPEANAVDAKVRVHGLGLQITQPDGQEWRSAMITAPVFPVSTPQAFYELLLASASKDPNAMPAFAKANPEIATFGAWAKTAPWTGSYAEDRFNSLNSFVFSNASGEDHVVRWSLLPEARPVAITDSELEKLGPDVLQTEIAQRVAKAPQRWKMVVTVANPGDPTADPSKAWPNDRRSVEVGTLVVERIEQEADGSCRDVNFDPTVLPPGMQTSDDPFPAARSAAYRVSYDLRTAEAGDYPRAAAGAKP
jgi:catalase